jgi:hypothetical protein
MRSALFFPTLACLCVAFACSSDKQHAPLANTDCTGTECSVVSESGGGKPDAGTGVVILLPDGGVAGTTVCAPDPTNTILLCEESSLCGPGVTVNPTQFSGCGFQLGAVDTIVHCVCPGNELCTLGGTTGCTSLEGMLASSMTSADFCNQEASVSFQGCTDLSALSGAGGGSSTCTPACKATCGNDQACDQIMCGC